MAANDYELVTGLACAYLARKTKSNKLISQDRRVITDNEILGLFEFYLRRRVERSGVKDIVVKRDGKEVFKAELLDVEEEKGGGKVEIKVGETFEYEGKVIIVKESDIHDCFECVFNKDNVACHKFGCTPGGRKDGTFVHFEEVKPDEVKKRAVKTKKAKTKEVKDAGN